jgi:hypothetical protein
MKKQTGTKIILGLIIFVFLVSFSQFISPLNTKAESDISNLYNNPNQDNGKNPYKFKISDVVSSNLLTDVVGCTGVVNKVSTWMTKFIQSPAQQAKLTADKIARVRAQLENACAASKASSEAAGDSIPVIGGLSKAIGTIYAKIKVGGVEACKDKVQSMDPELLKKAIEEDERDAEIQMKEQCFDGIAIKLAKNQLTSMTRSAVNWVNSGYGGSPFFVQNMTNLTNSIERNVLDTGIDILLSPGNENPYARDFARSTIRGYQTGGGLGSNSSNFLSGLSSDLSSFITDPSSYYTDDEQWQAQSTRTALQRAQDANNSFANDFSVGGWNGYLALTQRDQNNPLGFTMLASQKLADMQNEKITETNQELAQNNGFLSQKTCVKWQVYEENGKPKTIMNPNYGDGSTDTKSRVNVFTTTKPRVCYRSGGDCCASEEEGGWKIITPGSIIKDKTTSYLNSPERQLELADTINESLNALFSILISKLQGGGLSGLSESNLVNPTNWINDANSIDDTGSYDNNGAYNGFNLTRDLGNTYIHDDVTKAGTWNASTSVNLTNKNQSMILGYVPPVYDESDNIISSKIYWTVTNPGKTILIENGHNNWETGDRAFWDGNNWQNWKLGQTSPIKKRGVIQIQKDYIVAAKEILGVLPNIMENLGELDYCLPGPNPEYKTNSTDAQGAYQDWTGSMYVGMTDSTMERFGVRIDDGDKLGKRTYNNLKNIYAENPKVWNVIRNENTSLYNMPRLIYDFSNICNSNESNCKGHYFYAKNGNLAENDSEHLNEKTEEMNTVLDYVNNKMFQNFYDIFDKEMNDRYFKNMTGLYYPENESESITSSTPTNPSYMPMAESGLDLTKNILYYANDIEEVSKKYEDAITQAQININKLEPIRVEVSKIIKAAQDRRDANLLAQINKLNEATIQKCKDVEQACMEDERGTVACYAEYTKCLDEEIVAGGILSKEQYLAKYAQCLEEENIEFYDPEEIMGSGGSDSERCFNGIDDDLDRLVDSKDPDCTGVTTGGTTPPGPTYRCVSGVTTTTEPGMQTSPCVGRATKDECIGSTYYHQNQETQCDWITGTNPYTVTTSLYGCRIDTSVTMKPMYENATESCLIRTKENCTKTKYISEEHESYSCIFTEV